MKFQVVVVYFITCLLNLIFMSNAHSENWPFYVDTKTKQVFIEPGPGRVPIDQITKSSEVAPAVKPSDKPTDKVELADAPKKVTEKSWYDKLSLRGYTQFRTTFAQDDENIKIYHPADRTVTENQTFLIRRGRLILSGDVSDHLALYIQPDLSASSGDGDFVLQMRDTYADIAIDKEKEYRFRIGQSKVPYGFVNMQSSQNRTTTERADALNSAVEGERDIGAYFYWAPSEIRERFSMLVKDGLKGSGDYGVFGIGLYNGQGLNRSDQNDNKHTVARFSYPFKFPSGQYFEPGLQAYTGKYIPRTGSVKIDGKETTPSYDIAGVNDQRVGLTAVMYPQPVGFEAEWNIGKGPALSDDGSSINDESLTGGYFLLNSKVETSVGLVYPFLRWQYYDGGRKFGRNAPLVKVNEWDLGVEFLRWKDLELTAMYTYSNRRTNSNDFSYEDVTGNSRFALQAQFNY